jgi:hypothetical protein
MTKKSDPAVSLTPQDQILAIFESIFSANTKPYAKRLACESGPKGGLFDEKTEGQKSRDTVPLNNTRNWRGTFSRNS